MLQPKILEEKIKPILNKAAYNAILSTFSDNLRSKEALDAAEKIATEFAKNFSNAAAPDLAKEIDSYIKTADIDLTKCASVQNLIVAGTSPAGPVTGTSTGSLTGIVIGGLQ